MLKFWEPSTRSDRNGDFPTPALAGTKKVTRWNSLRHTNLGLVYTDEEAASRVVTPPALPHRPLLHPHHPRIRVEGGAGADREDELLLDVAEGEAGEDGDW